MKEFKVAHIAPVSELDYTFPNQYHMCLAHLVKESPEYTAFYANLKKNNFGHFVLMDNGAAEGSQLDPHELVEMYDRIHPDEIVLPDTLFDGASTIQKTENFLEVYGDLPYRKMAVPQGQNLRDWVASATVLVQDKRINTIGVSKFLNIATKNKWIRYYACHRLAGVLKEIGRDDIEVHLLGCDEGPLVVRAIHDAFPFVRGCDSAFAYIATQSGMAISDYNADRPEGEIDFLNGPILEGFEANMEAFNRVAGVQNNGLCASWMEED